MITALELKGTFKMVDVGYQFLGCVNEENQSRLFPALENMLTLTILVWTEGLVPAGEHGGNRGIHLLVLLESLPSLVSGCHELAIILIVFRNQSEVELLTDAVGGHAGGGSLGLLDKPG
jgi:hypothetical protein